MQPETRYAKSGDVHIAYQVSGAGPLDLVFVPGWVSHLESAWEDGDYSRFLRRLGPRLRNDVQRRPSISRRRDRNTMCRR